MDYPIKLSTYFKKWRPNNIIMKIECRFLKDIYRSILVVKLDLIIVHFINIIIYKKIFLVLATLNSNKKRT